MPNLSSRAPLTAVGAGATFLALALAPLAHGDADPGYAGLGAIVDAVSAFENAFGSNEDALFVNDLLYPPNLLSASGIDFGGDPFPSGATGSDDVATIASTGTTITGQLTNISSEITGTFDHSAVLAGTDNDELPVVNAVLEFQQQINADVASLPAITAQDASNPLLLADLSALDLNEANLSASLVNTAYELSIASPAALTDDNAYILADSMGILTDVQSTSDTLTFLTELSSLGL
jgi:hypothetical protein